MRLCRLAAVLVPLAAVTLEGAEPPPGVQIVKGSAIAEKIDRSAPSPGGRGGIFAQDEGWRVHVAERDQPGLAELHDEDTDVWYVIAGGGTVVLGGTIVDSSATGPGEHRGPSITGGTEHAVGAGDVVSIRPGIAHWVKAVDGRLRYMVVKVRHGPAARAGR